MTGSSLKGIFYNLGTKLIQGHYIQQLASIAVAITVATTLLDKFEDYLDKIKGDFNDLKNLDFSSYLMAFIDLSGLDQAVVIVISAMAFAITWRFTYDLKPKSKVSN